ncbi:hypothetical protein D3C71_1170150 [compost metagenome]
MHHEQVGVARSQQVRADADGRHRKEAVGGRLDGIGQLHAADLVVLRGRQQAGFCVGLARLVGRLGQDDLFTVEAWLLDVYGAVEGRVLLASDALAGVEHRIEGFARVVCKTRADREGLGIEPVIQQKVERGTQGHQKVSLWLRACPISIGLIGLSVQAARCS